MRSEPSSLSIEVLRRWPLVFKRPISASDCVSVVMSSFDRATHVEARVMALTLLLRVAESRTSRRLTYLHPGRECVFQEYAPVLILNCIFRGPSLLSTNTTRRRDRVVMVAVVRRQDVIRLEMVSRDPLSLRVFLSSCSPWIKEVVY
jgi:hypothetical protein